MAIGSARLEDLPAILDLLERCGLPLDGFAGHLATALVAREENRVVAGAALELYEPGALLRSVAVDESRRGRGLGKRVAGAALEMAQDRGIGAVYLFTETAEAFFAGLGFESIPRSRVPAPVQASVEFQTACPDTAQAMVLQMPPQP